MKTIRVFLAVATSLTLSGVAFADPPARGAAAARSTAQTDGYGYTFSDDPLAAGGLSATDATIKIRPGAMRAVLTRPRTSFVAEMLASVEKL
jgi:outer membrane lipoprotein-sorting protein